VCSCVPYVPGDIMRASEIKTRPDLSTTLQEEE
jgi:hypothetical protein